MLRLGRITLLGALVGTIDTASSTGVANTPIGSLGETLALNRITKWLPISRDAEHEMERFGQRSVASLPESSPAQVLRNSALAMAI